MTLAGVGFKYGEAWALKGIDLEVRPGEILGILGPNGSGKSTLLKLMDGIFPPLEGEIRFNGTRLSRMKRAGVARAIAMVAQENYFQFPFTALEVVLMGRFPHLRGLQFEGDRDLRVALDALAVTDALDLAERPIHELSGGEKQRILLARALAQEPRVILLDEPTSFLDLKYKRDIFRLIASLSREKGLSVVLVSHDIDLSAQYCERLVLLREGEIFISGAPGRVVTSETVTRVYDCPVEVDQNPATGRPRVNVK